jgi:hypothetical protein
VVKIHESEIVEVVESKRTKSEVRLVANEKKIFDLIPIAD